MKKLLFILLFPALAFGQDTLEVENADVRIVAPDLFQVVYDTTQVIEHDTVRITRYDTVKTIVRNEQPVLRDVQWQHVREDSSYNMLDILGRSGADSVRVIYRYDHVRLDSVFVPDSAFHIRLKTKFLGPIRMEATGWDSVWKTRYRETVDMAVLDTLGGLRSITGTQDTIFMALPTGTDYAETTLPNPNSDLTDVVVTVDLADMPQDWWDAVNTSEATRGRASKDDGSEEAATELATHWFGFDDVNQEGIVFVRWSGTNSASLSETLRIYPPDTSNTAYADTATFGSQATWQDETFVLPLTESGNGTAGEFADVTGNGHAGQGGGGTSGDTPVQTSADHPFGLNWNLFDGGGDYVELANSLNALEATALTVRCIFLPEGDGTDESGIIDKRIKNQDSGGYWTMNYSDDVANERRLVTNHSNGSTSTGDILGATNIDSASVSAPIWVGFTWTANRARTILDGAVDADVTSGVPDPANFAGNDSPITLMGYWDLSNVRTTNGKLGFAMARTGELSTDHLLYEYQNQSDLTNFWGTWSWQGGGQVVGVSMSLGAQNDISQSGAASVSAGVSAGSQNSVDPSGGATGNASLPVAAQQGISALAEVIANGTIPVGAQQTISISSEVDGTINVSLSVGAQNLIEAAATATGNASVSQQSVHNISVAGAGQVAESLSLALQSAISMERDTEINVSLSQGSLSGISTTSTAQANATLSQTLQNGLSLTAQALSEAGLTNATITGITITGSSVTTNVTLADGRTFSITFETRTASIDPEDRTHGINNENRTYTID